MMGEGAALAGQRAVRTVAAINDRIRHGRASVATVAELAGMASDRRASVDVVTLGFTTPFAGTAAMLCVPVAGRGVFTRAERISLDGVPGVPGPAPNERLGVVDTLVVVDRPVAGLGPHAGARLLAALICGERVKVECRSVEGTFHAREATLDDIDFARLYVYSAEVPGAQGRRPPFLDVLCRGARILVNGADGMIVGRGSRDSAAVAGISLAADMHGMAAPQLDGEAVPHHVVALAVPLLDPAFAAELVGWRSQARPAAALGSIGEEAAEDLAARIREGRFVLTDGDRPL